MEHEKIKISIIVPVYKAEPYLRQCVDSLLAQTHKNLEIILVDDGSPDRCPVMCDEYAARDDRVQVIHKKNGGQSSARNAGLDVMSGEYVMFVDSDDWIEPAMVEYLLNVARGSGCDAVSTGIIREYEKTYQLIEQPEEELNTVTGIELLQDFYQGNLWEINIVMCHLYRTELFQGLRFQEGMIYEDSAILFPLLYRCKRIVRSNQRFYHYYFSQDSTLRSGFSVKRFDVLKAMEMQMEFCGQHGLDDLLEQVKVAYYMQIAHLRYDMTIAKWPDSEKCLPSLKEKADKVEVCVKNSQYFDFKKKIKRVMFICFPWLTKLVINQKRKIDRKRLGVT